MLFRSASNFFSPRAGKNFPVLISDRAIAPADVENIRHADIQAFEGLRFFRLHPAVCRHAVGRDDNTLAVFREQVVDEQRGRVRMRRTLRQKDEARAVKERLDGREPERRALPGER